jgi:hypothetical protein
MLDYQFCGAIIAQKPAFSRLKRRNYATTTNKKTCFQLLLIGLNNGNVFNPLIGLKKSTWKSQVLAASRVSKLMQKGKSYADPLFRITGL